MFPTRKASRPWRSSEWIAGNENLDEIEKSIRLLRLLMPDCKVALIVEANEPIDPHRVLTLSPDACIFNLGQVGGKR